MINACEAEKQIKVWIEDIKSQKVEEMLVKVCVAGWFPILIQLQFSCHFLVDVSVYFQQVVFWSWVLLLYLLAFWLGFLCFF